MVAWEGKVEVGKIVRAGMCVYTSGKQIPSYENLEYVVKNLAIAIVPQSPTLHTATQ